MLSPVQRSSDLSFHSHFFHSEQLCMCNLPWHSLMYALSSILNAKLNIPAVTGSAEYSTGTSITNPFDTRLFCRSHTGSRELLPFHFKAPQSGIFFFFTAKITHLKWNHNWIWDHALPDMVPFSLDTGVSGASYLSKWLSCNSVRIWLIRRA